MNTDTAVWIIVLAGMVAMGGFLRWLLVMVSRGRMMRCPETGAISVVRVVPAAD